MEIHEQINAHEGGLSDRILLLINGRTLVKEFISHTYSVSQLRRRAENLLAESDHWLGVSRTALKLGNETAAMKAATVALVLLEEAREIVAGCVKS